ncbi:methyltransferase [Actinokineospora sp.]|uniref:methyltransferase n=1 Tax=Actinokineospora sp. TaxID=1872133 RepID=UPI004037AF2C
MSNPGTAQRSVLLGILTSTWIAQSCSAVARLGVPDLLAAGPRTVADLAAAAGADERALYRVLRALAAAGLFTESAGQTFALRRGGELLRSDVPGSVRANALIYGDEVIRSFAEITHTLRTGQPAFDKVHGKSFYDYLDEHPEIDQVFTAAQGVLAMPPALAECDLADVATLVDIGGGEGALLAEILAGHPRLRGVLVERAEVLCQAKVRLADVGDRVELVEGDFFESAPGGGDAYVLCRVLHNWTDEKAARILRTTRAAMPPTSRLIVLEDTVSDGEPTRESKSATLVDLLMLVMMEGYDRTVAQYRALLAEAGFDVLAVHHSPSRATEVAIEARPLP